MVWHDGMAWSGMATAWLGMICHWLFMSMPPSDLKRILLALFFISDLDNGEVRVCAGFKSGLNSLRR